MAAAPSRVRRSRPRGRIRDPHRLDERARAQHTAELLPNGKVLVAGGNDLLGPLSSAEIWDPATGTWTPTAPLAQPRARHTTTVLQTGRVLATGGSPGPTTELYDLNVLDVGAEQTITVELAPAKPNPFVRSTQMDYALAANGRVRLALYDVRGRLLTTLVDRELPAGHYSASWDGRRAERGPGPCRYVLRAAYGRGRCRSLAGQASETRSRALEGVSPPAGLPAGGGHTTELVTLRRRGRWVLLASDSTLPRGRYLPPVTPADVPPDPSW